MNTAVFLLVIGLYLLPTLIVLFRPSNLPNGGSAVVVNIFLGWTLVGWVVALAMACRSRPQVRR